MLCYVCPSVYRPWYGLKPDRSTARQERVCTRVYSRTSALRGPMGNRFPLTKLPRSDDLTFQNQ